MAHTSNSASLLLLLLLLAQLLVCSAGRGSIASDGAAAIGDQDGIICPLFCLENVEYSKCKSVGPKRLPGACNCCLLRRALLGLSPRYATRPPSKCSLYLSNAKVVHCNF